MNHVVDDVVGHGVPLLFGGRRELRLDGSFNGVNDGSDSPMSVHQLAHGFR